MNIKDENDEKIDIDELLREAEIYENEMEPEPEEEHKKKIEHRVSKIAAVLVVAVLAVVLTVYFSSGRKSDKTANKNIDNKEAVVTVENKENKENKLQEDAYEEITGLAKMYLNAKLTGDVSSLSKYVDNMEGINQGDIKSEENYIQEYTNVVCYTKNGLDENSYVVYVSYDLKIKNIKTKVPGTITLYVLRDKETGNVFIHNGMADTEIQDYIDKLEEDEDVKSLFNDINTELQSAIKSDDELKEFYAALQKAETTTAAKK